MGHLDSREETVRFYDVFWGFCGWSADGTTTTCTVVSSYMYYLLHTVGVSVSTVARRVLSYSWYKTASLLMLIQAT